MEKKKPIYKKVWFWAIVAIVVIAIAGTSDDEEEKQADPVAPVTEQVPAPVVNNAEVVKEEPVPEPEEPKNGPGISKEEFDKIKNGMTYKEVVEIIGGEGEVLSEVGEEGSQFYTIMYSFDGESGFGANANFTFQSGKLMSKAQFGLE